MEGSFGLRLLTGSAAFDFEAGDAFAQVGDVAGGFEFGAEVRVFEQGAHLGETGIHFVFEAFEVGFELPGFGIDLCRKTAELQFNFFVQLFHVAFQLPQFRGDEIL